MIGFGLVLVGSCLVMAQEIIPPLAGNYEMVVVTGSSQMATVSEGGEVKIDWEQTEKIAADPAARNMQVAAIARLMIAIRDGTWKPVK